MGKIVEQTANSPSGIFAHSSVLSLLKPLFKHYKELKHRLMLSQFLNLKQKISPLLLNKELILSTQL